MIKLTEFFGLMPKIASRNKPIQVATVAENVNLDNGTLKPFRSAKFVANATGERLFVDNCCIVTGDCHSQFAKTGISCDEIIVATGLTTQPVYSRNQCPFEWYPLSFSCELPKPTALFSGLPTSDLRREVRSYVYTLVNEMGWESQPSYPSDEIVVNTTEQVVVTGLPVTGGVKVRLYRTQNELDFGVQQQEEVESTYLLVDEFDIGQTTYIDNVLYLGEPCLTEEYRAVPDDLREVQSWREGRLAGLSGNTFRMSERNQPHAWGDKYTVTFYDQAIALICTNRIGYVLTDGKPVILELKGDCEDGQPVIVTEIAEILPIIARRSAAEYLGGCVYASAQGLVLLSGDNATILTKDYYSQAQWQALHPHTMRGVVYQGYYYGTTDTTTIRFRLPDNIYATDNKTALTTLSIRPQDWFKSEDNRLYYLDNGSVYEWEQGDDELAMHWRGNLNTLPAIVHFGAYKVVADESGNQISHFVDGREIQTYTHKLNQPTRLPVGKKGIDWQVEIKGKAEVFEYHLATSIRELANQ